jgi:hypothetical protein
MSAVKGMYPADGFRQYLSERREVLDRMTRVTELACAAADRLDKVLTGELDHKAFWREPVAPSGTGFPDFNPFVADADRLLKAHAGVMEKRVAAQKQLAKIDQVLGAEKSRRRHKAAARVGLLLLFLVLCGAITLRVMTAS